MAAITSSTTVYQSPDVAERLVVYALRNVTTGDTFDTVALFSKVNYATFYPVTNRSLTASATIANTIITMNAASLVGDGGFLVVLGEGPQ